MLEGPPVREGPAGVTGWRQPLGGSGFFGLSLSPLPLTESLKPLMPSPRDFPRVAQFLPSEEQDDDQQYDKELRQAKSEYIHSDLLWFQPNFLP